MSYYSPAARVSMEKGNREDDLKIMRVASSPYHGAAILAISCSVQIITNYQEKRIKLHIIFPWSLKL